MKIGMTYDLKEDYLQQGFSLAALAEFESKETIDAIEAALFKLDAQVIHIGHIKNLVAKLASGERFDLVFNIAEGMYGFGREAQIPALLDAYQIPYTFSDPLTLSLALHKGMTKRVLSTFNIASAPFMVVETLADLQNISLHYPLFAKPIAQGTSKGILPSCKVGNGVELSLICERLLAEYSEPVLVEEYLPGREFTVGIIGTGAKAYAIGVMEIQFTKASGDIYGFDSKQSWSFAPQYHVTCDALAEEVSSVALRAWRALGCRDAGRVDMRLDAAGVPSVIEINPLAGLRPNYSDLPVLCDLAGLPYQTLIEKIIRSAWERESINLPCFGYPTVLWQPNGY